ncbi:MAG: hypothetical protein ACI8P3_000064 [Saprospiraceae bacterium]|jgi:hypothetical protein
MKNYSTFKLIFFDMCIACLASIPPITVFNFGSTKYFLFKIYRQNSEEKQKYAYI